MCTTAEWAGDNVVVTRWFEYQTLAGFAKWVPVYRIQYTLPGYPVCDAMLKLGMQLCTTECLVGGHTYDFIAIDEAEQILPSTY